MTTSTPSQQACTGERGLVVLCAANNWDDVRLADRPLAKALARKVDVLYVDPPLSHLTPRNNPRVAAALAGPRLRAVAPGILRLTPVVTPLPFRHGMLPLTRALVRRTIRRALAAGTCRLPVQGVVTTWLDIDVFDLVPGARHLDRAQDDVAAGAALWGQDRERLIAGERRVAGLADTVLLANPEAVGVWGLRGHEVVAFPNGCDTDRFTPRPAVAPHPWVRHRDAPVAGFVGHLNRRTDVALLEAVVDRGLTLVLVGPIDAASGGPRLEELLERDTVHAVGACDFEEVAAWLWSFDVGLVPYRNDEFNRWSFPLKTLEYLAAGLPVVSRVCRRRGGWLRGTL